MNVSKQAFCLSLVCMVGLQGFVGTAAQASGYEVVFERTYHPTSGGFGNVHSLIRTRDGGYAFSGWGYARDPWLVKTDAAGKKQWEVLIPGSRGADSDAFVVLNAPDGGFLLGGRSNSHDLVPGDWKGDGTPKRPYGYRYTPIVAFAARFDQGGHLLWRKAYRRLGNVRSAADFTCGEALSDGFFMVGGTVKFRFPPRWCPVPYCPSFGW